MKVVRKVRKLSKLVTVSAKIPEELKKKMNNLNIKPSEIIKEAIENEIKRREIEELKETLEEVKPILAKLSVERVVKSIREDRESR